MRGGRPPPKTCSSGSRRRVSARRWESPGSGSASACSCSTANRARLPSSRAPRPAPPRGRFKQRFQGPAAE
eukprot:9245771-Alexandrium_andersonii.AAC.1